MEEEAHALDQDAGVLFPGLLIIAGAIICSVVLVESYLQISRAPISLLDIAHDNGYLVKYERSIQPNKGLWLPTGIIGSVCFIIMMLYSIRKRFRFMRALGPIRLWLDTHMFLGIVGAALITAHSTYKFDGLVAISYWSMMIVAVSGLFGRYIYGWIPHQVSGRELEINEIRSTIASTDKAIASFTDEEAGSVRYYDQIFAPQIDKEKSILVSVVKMVSYDIRNMFRIIRIWFELGFDSRLPAHAKRKIFKLIKRKSVMIRSVNFLSTARRLLHYWHVLHKPLAAIMFLVMFIHIAVYLIFRVEV